MNIAKPSMAYPFVTRRQVLERLACDPAFVREWIAILHRRFVERATLEPPAGWMSSHRKLGEELHARITVADCSDADLRRATEIATRYAKQLTRVLRDDQLAQDPRLGLAAAVFGVRSALGDHGGSACATSDGPEAVGDGDDVTTRDDTHGSTRSDAAARAGAAAEAQTVGLQRRRGRPKGSKNRPKVGGRVKVASRRRTR